MLLRASLAIPTALSPESEGFPNIKFMLLLSGLYSRAFLKNELEDTPPVIYMQPVPEVPETEAAAADISSDIR